MADKDDKIFKKQSKNFKNRSILGKTSLFSNIPWVTGAKKSPRLLSKTGRLIF
jgi:hypothetical protein